MNLVQILVPVYDREKNPFPRADFDRLKTELTERFGGVTAHLRAPASGAWKDEGGDVERDDVVIYEVMADELDREWWRGYREELARRFGQEEMVIRAMECRML